MSICPACRLILAGMVEPKDTARTMQTVLAMGSGARLEAGTTVGRYLVRGVLGEGAMGIVYEVEDPQLLRRVALKVLKRDANGAHARSMLREEAQALSKLQHPNVVPVFDIGQSPHGWFIAMEFIEGQPLDVHCVGRPWTEVVDRFIEAGRGLAAAHAMGIVHRDFKPANVFVGRDGRARVLDFGIARTGLPLDVETLERLGTPSEAPLDRPLVGTVAYMSPEQLLRIEATAHSDQYAFFVSIFEAMEGRRPFEGTTLAGQVLERAATPLRLRWDATPTHLRALIETGLSKRPTDRHPSMRAVVDVLEAQRRRRGGSSRGSALAALLGVAATGAFLSRNDRAATCAREEASVAASVEAHAAAARERWSGELPEPTRATLHSRLTRFGKVMADQATMACATGDAETRWCVESRMRRLDAAVSIALQPETPANRVMEVMMNATPSGTCNRSVDADHGMQFGIRAAVDAWNADAMSLNLAQRYRESARVLREHRDVIDRLGTGSQAAYAQYNDALTLAGVGDTKAALEEFVEAHALASASADERMPAVIAVAVLQYIPIVRPEDTEAWIKRAEVDVDRAADHRLRAQFHIAAGWAERRRGRHERAMEHAQAASDGLQAIAETSDLSWRVEALLGSIALSRLDPEAALVHYHDALERLEHLEGGASPRGLQARAGIAQAFIALGDLEQARFALEGYEAATERFEDREQQRIANVDLIRSDFLVRIGDDGAALAILREVMGRLDPSNPSWFSVANRIGLTHLQRGEYRQARDVFERVRVWSDAELGPEHKRSSITLHNLAEAEAGLGEFDEAAAHYRLAVELMDRSESVSSARAYPLTGLGEVELKRGRPRRAAAVLEEALSAQVQDRRERAETQASLAQALWRLGETGARVRALELANAAAAVFDDSPGYERQALELSRWRETL